MLLYEQMKVIPPQQLIHIVQENKLRRLVELWCGYPWQFIEFGTLDNFDVIGVYLDRNNDMFLIEVDIE